MNYKILSLVLMLSLLVVGIYFYLKPEQTQTQESISYPYKVQTQYGLLEKDYEPSTEIVTLTKEDTLTLSQIKLNTPHNNRVGAGYQKVAEIEFTAYEDFKQYLSESYFELYNINDGMKPIERQLDFKYLTTEQISVDDFKTECSDNSTGNAVCSQIKTGSHFETREAWKDINEYTFKSGEPVKIGIFTDVQIGDNVEWIPTIYGVEIKEWAVWTNDLNVGLKSYYKLDETSGTIVIDSVGYGNGTSTQTLLGVTGKIGTAQRGGNSSAKIDLASGGYEIGSNGKYSINFWFNGSVAQGYFVSNFVRDYSNNMYGYGLDLDGAGKLGGVHGVGTGTPATGTYSTSAINNNAWHMISLTYDGVTNNMTTYIDGAIANTNSVTDPLFSLVKKPSIFGFYYNDGAAFDSKQPFTVDELGIWNRTLTQAEVTQLYNGGSGITWQANPTIVVSLISPNNNTNFTTNNVNFSVNVTPNNLLITNVSLLINGTIVQTNTSGFNGRYNFSRTLSDKSYNWTIIAYGNDSVRYNATNGTLFFNVDATLPKLTINYPTTELNYGRVNGTLQLNWTVTDTNLNKCWYDYNGTNITLGTCTSNSPNLVNITLTTRKYVLVHANDTSGNLNSTNISWSYKVFENERFFNNQSGETAYESYALNLTANSSLTSVRLFVNASHFSTLTQSGSIWNYSTDLPLNLSGNNSFYFNFTYGGNYIISDNSTQLVNKTFFDICNSTLTTKYLNISFKDENTLTGINASIPTSSFVYYLGSGVINKTLTYSNTTNNHNYTFCATPSNKPFYVLPVVQYRQVSDYPQRIWEPSLRTYNSTITNQVLYLLSTTDGIYVTYQVLNTANSPIQGVDVVASRTISGDTVIVGVGQTDSAGLVTFWMNPDFVHTVTFTKSGYESFTLNHFPTQASYTITLGSTTPQAEDLTRGITYRVRPTAGTSLPANTMTNFNFTINSTYWTLDSFAFTLTNQLGTVIGGNTSSSSTGGTILNIINTSNYSRVTMTPSWVINGTDSSVIYYWGIFDNSAGAWSITNFFTDLSAYAGQGLLGLDSDSLSLLVFIIIFVSVGIMSYKFGLTSPAVISGVVFVLVFFFDVALGLIPTPINAVPHFPTILIGIIMVSLIIKETTT